MLAFRVVVLALAVGPLFACSDSTGPAPVPDSLVITGGNFQEARVTERLPSPLRVEARRGAQPVGGVLICFVAITSGAGVPFMPCAQTDGNGAATMPWDLGTVAGEHIAEARAMIDEEPVAVATYEIRALPGLPANISIPEWVSVWLGDPVDLLARASVRDAWGNAIPRDEVAVAGELPEEWSLSDGAVVAHTEWRADLEIVAGSVSAPVEVIGLYRPIGQWEYRHRCGEGSWNGTGQLDSLHLATSVAASNEDGPLWSTSSSAGSQDWPQRSSFRMQSPVWIAFPADGEPFVAFEWNDHSINTMHRPGQVAAHISGRSSVWNVLDAAGNPPTSWEGAGTLQEREDDHCGGAFLGASLRP